ETLEVRAREARLILGGGLLAEDLLRGRDGGLDRLAHELLTELLRALVQHELRVVPQTLGLLLGLRDDAITLGFAGLHHVLADLRDLRVELRELARVLRVLRLGLRLEALRLLERRGDLRAALAEERADLRAAQADDEPDEDEEVDEAADR